MKRNRIFRYMPVVIIALIFCSTLAIAQPSGMPHVIFGEISDTDGNTMANVHVNITNQETDETLTAVANNNGQYQVDLYSLPSGYDVGDSILVESYSGNLEGSSTVTVSTGPNDQCNVVLEPKPESTGIPFPGVLAIAGIFVAIGLAASFRKQ